MRRSKEDKILPNIKENLDIFYSYAKAFATADSGIGPLMDENDVLKNEDEKMASILATQYRNMWSTPATDISREKLSHFFNTNPVAEPPVLGACGPTGGGVGPPKS